MDSLEEQLEKLQMMTNQQLQSGKKIGPLVPPKPKKSQPQVPKSCQIKQTCNPSYSTILQNNQMNFDSSSTPRNVNNTYSNIGVENSIQKHEIIKTNATPRSYENAQSGEFIPGRIYENQKLNVTSVQKPQGILNPDLNGPNNLHIYSNAPLKKIENKPNQNPVYSNISFENSHNYHPPPPLDVQVIQNYGECDEEFPPPPSPVSSSYSELRRATDNNYPPISVYATQQLNKFNQMNQMPGINHEVSQPYNINYNPSDYVAYAQSQGSSTYESIYEPINPRPPSMSSRSNYSLYTPYEQQGGGKISSIKEAEVNLLTDMLVNSMDNCQDVDSYGICVKCEERIVGENSGCTAMDQVYHIGCFTCYHCQINLQGKPFYNVDGKPYCEEDYLNTLEKCSVCVKPILERILRATGKPYHPGCFCCVVCGKSLDGIPFTVDATNQIHCIEDFHKKFAPRCCVCQKPIMPEPGQEETVRVVALDRSFHIACYKCEDCGLPLSSSSEGRGCYPLDDHVLCKSCNAKRVQMLTNHMTTEL